MIYFDANSTARQRPCLSEVYSRLLSSTQVRNPSSVHAAGRVARAKLNEAKEIVREFFDAEDSEIVFTSGGTEACNAIALGFLDIQNPGHILYSAVEHPAISEPLLNLKKYGFEVQQIPVTTDGRVDVEDALELVREDTQLVSLMLASNESGAVQPVLKLAESLRNSDYEGVIISDATQAAGKYIFSASEYFEAGVDAFSISGHKFGGPRGTGAFLIANCHKDSCRIFTPNILGGPQQNRFRAGTENLIGIIALAEVCHELEDDLRAELEKISSLREILWRDMNEQLSFLERLTPTSGPVLSNTLLVRVPGCLASDLVAAMDIAGICISAGAACSSGRQEPSVSALAQGFTKEEAGEVIRFSLDWDADVEQVRKTIKVFSEIVGRMLNLDELDKNYKSAFNA